MFTHHYSTMQLRGPNQLRDENSKGTLGCGSGIRLSWGLVGVRGEGKGEDAKTLFWRGMFIISRTFVRGRHCLTASDWLPRLYDSQLGVGNEVVEGGW